MTLRTYCHSYDKEKCKSTNCVFLRNNGYYDGYDEEMFDAFKNGKWGIRQIDEHTLLLKCIGGRAAIFSKLDKLEYYMKKIIKDHEEEKNALSLASFSKSTK
jgi:hypothetical protein